MNIINTGKTCYIVSIMLFSLVIGCSHKAPNHNNKQLLSHVIIIQPIVVRNNEGTEAASMALPEDLIEKAYSGASLDFVFLEPIYFNHTKARDGLINLDEISKIAKKQGLLKGQGDIVNMFFVKAVDGNSGPLGRAQMKGNIIFIALGDQSKQDNLVSMQAFVVAHEIGHNLSLKHVIDDPNVPNNLPNIQGDGVFSERIDPKFSLNAYQIKAVLNSPLTHDRISFLDKVSAQKAILDESFEPYFSKLQKREIETFINKEVKTNDLTEARKIAKREFSSAVLEFSIQEKTNMQLVVKEVIRDLQNIGFNTVAESPWRFIKIQEWLSGGFAHTRGTFIIMSNRHLKLLHESMDQSLDKQQRQKSLLAFKSILVHEQFHTLQRTFPSKFKTLIKNYWGFQPTNIELTEELKLNQVSNPDAPQANWLIPSEGDGKLFYWVRTLLKTDVKLPQMGKDFITKVFLVELKDGGHHLKTTPTGGITSLGLEELSEYTQRFPVSRGIDHPNEISAYMFAEYYSDLITGKKPFSEQPQSTQKTIRLFIDWLFELK